MELVGYFAAVIIGITLGLLGGGGSILTIPLLVYLFDLDPVPATAYSLFLVGVTSLAAFASGQKRNLVNYRAGFLFGLPAMLSIFVTRHWIVHALPEQFVTLGGFTLTKRLFLLGLFAVMMIVTSYSMIRGRDDTEASEPHLTIISMVALGTAIGVLTGLVGAGGGFLIIPALIFLAGLSMKAATATSLFVVGTNSLIGFIGDVFNLQIEWRFLILLTVLAIIGIVIGNWLSTRIKGQHLRKAFGWVTLVMGFWILIKELS